MSSGRSAQPNSDAEATKITGTIKVGFTSDVRHLMVDLLQDEARGRHDPDGKAKRALDTLQREKTNIVVESEEERDAITYELEQMYDHIRMGHPHYTMATANACMNAVEEINKHA